MVDVDDTLLTWARHGPRWPPPPPLST